MSRRWRHVLIALAAVGGMVLTASMGRWQLQRAAQKEALVQAIARQADTAALSGADVLAPQARTDWLYRPVQLRGRWLAEHTVYVDNRQMKERVGFYVFTPLQLLDAPQVIMVQRGWIPRNFEHRSRLEAVQTPAGVVQVQGRIALPPSKLYEPGAAVPGVIRQNLDLAEFGQETGLPVVQDLSVVQTGAASEGLLREWPAINLGVDMHYGYAAQWFAMAALIGVLYGWFQLRPFVVVAKESHVSHPTE